MEAKEVINLIKTARGWMYEYRDLMREEAFTDQGEDPDKDRENLKLVIRWIEDADRGLSAAESALRSYERGNAAKDLAKTVADYINGIRSA